MPASFVVSLLTICAAVSLATSSRAATFIEAESAVSTQQMHGGDGGLDRKLTAWGGDCLGNGWGRARGDWAHYPIDAPGGATTIHLRYARQPLTPTAPSGARLRLRMGDVAREIELPSTGNWELWRWIAVPMGELAKGAHTLRLETLSENAPINLDALSVAPSNQMPLEVSRPLLFDGSRHLRIQLSPSVKPLPTDQLFAIGEATYGFLKEYLGEEPSQKLTVNVIAPAEQRNDFVGHSVGYAMYLEEAPILNTAHNWAHEMTHCFQRESGSWPTWLSEGEAWLTYFDAESSVFGRAPNDITFSPQLFRSRLPKLRETLIVENRNQLQRWGQPDFPGHKVGAAYGFSNFILAELREKYGPSLMQRYRALLREDRKQGAREENLSIEARDAAVVNRLGRAANADLRPLFASWGFVLQ